VLRTTPTDVHALNLLGIVRAQQKREVEAESLFKQAIVIRPDFAGAHASLGLLYMQMGKDDLAISPLQDAIRFDPGRKDAQSALIHIWRNQAHVAVQNGDSEKALALLISARKLSPSDPDVQFDFGIVALRMSLFPDAIDAFNEVLKIRPEDDRSLYALGRAKIATAKFDDAQQAFAHYIQLRPADASGHYALGVALQALQRTSDARREYEKSIALQPLQTESYFQLGLLDIDAGNTDTAREKFEQVLKRAPQHGGALTGLGRVRLQEKKYSDAATLFEKAIAANSESREAHYYLGLTDARLSKKEESEKELQTASQIEHEEVERHQNMLRILDPDQIQSDQIQPDQTHGAASNPNQ
jgi:tetratricopeptide (TPR) repeat protein